MNGQMKAEEKCLEQDSNIGTGLTFSQDGRMYVDLDWRHSLSAWSTDERIFRAYATVGLNKEWFYVWCLTLSVVTQSTARTVLTCFSFPSLVALPRRIYSRPFSKKYTNELYRSLLILWSQACLSNLILVEVLLLLFSMQFKYSRIAFSARIFLNTLLERRVLSNDTPNM